MFSPTELSPLSCCMELLQLHRQALDGAAQEASLPGFLALLSTQHYTHQVRRRVRAKESTVDESLLGLSILCGIRLMRTNRRRDADVGGLRFCQIVKFVAQCSHSPPDTRVSGLTCSITGEDDHLDLDSKILMYPNFD